MPQDVVDGLLNEGARNAAVDRANELVFGPREDVRNDAEAALERVVGNRQAIEERDPDRSPMTLLVPLDEALPPERSPGPLSAPDEIATYVRRLEAAASEMERGLSPAASNGGPAAHQTGVARGRGVAAWLRARESELLLTCPMELAAVQKDLANGLIAISVGDWPHVTVKPETEKAEPERFKIARRVVSRLVPALVLAALIWLLPEALSLNGDAAAALRVALIVPTVSALFAPAQAFTEAGKAVTQFGTGGRDARGGSEGPSNSRT
jgi:hypothetical protein